VIIGSQIVTTLGNAKEGERGRAVQDYCSQICGRTGGEYNNTNGLTREVGIVETMKSANEPNGDTVNGISGHQVQVDKVITDADVPSEPGLADQLDALNSSTNGSTPNPDAIPSRFGQFGGQYVPESLMDCLAEL
jgi:tryptophan synthase